MSATEILDLISDTIRRVEEGTFEQTVAARAAEGWANPTLQAMSETQGYDNGIIFGTFAEALAELKEYGTPPGGIEDFDPEEDGDPQHWLVNHLDNAGCVGGGAPLAYIGKDGYYTLICEGTTASQIESAVLDCYPDDVSDDGPNNHLPTRGNNL